MVSTEQCEQCGSGRGTPSGTIWFNVIQCVVQCCIMLYILVQCTLWYNVVQYATMCGETCGEVCGPGRGTMRPWPVLD